MKLNPFCMCCAVNKLEVKSPLPQQNFWLIKKEFWWGFLQGLPCMVPLNWQRDRKIKEKPL